ncbi:HPr kinase/phosphorylase [Rhodobacter sp. SY28-1]|uniref:HPr kinase/phosphorylase n=1 Tax=Rhodobacter sp. SY28-1 TaxID=2562317 RepID=UPI0010C00222|nr:HPr kinase/phosphatase C-terminal domain-containing protein [Rhodobacter sp. SY28-1]
MTQSSETLHATCVAVDGRGLLILGPSGAGKSALALQLISRGAVLVSDDLTRLEGVGGTLWASCPNPDLQGMIEARGVGILRAPSVSGAEVGLVVDLGQMETDRLPPRRKVTILGISLSLVLHVQNDHFPDALMLYLRHGREA